ncbi:excitatory amino acid transporter 1-like [Kryptolebias marmoratus]|uniref:excitatory amino acid transporter 1-like n=1 Tax=Kryptolebias marmoratus TaxID=37003 RepID=UPI0007F86F5E|nr:excitatory amino acid transporter 1-like [Kryptolebias marmoratus]XP_017266629.1 excitatory amino acid transporter 1-like [Kryptolebias marmoratus]
MNNKFQSSQKMLEIKSGEAVQPEENQLNHSCSEPLSQVMFNKKKWNIWTFIKKNAFVILTMTAMAVGIGLGFALRQVNMSPREIMYVTFPGELLMRILKMMVLPLVISSLITGMSNVGIKTYGRIGLRAFSYYMVTTVIATFTGIALAVSIKPGKSSRQTSEPSGGKSQTVQSVDSFLDLIRNMLPSNLVEACFKKYKTVYKSSGNHLDVMNTPSNIPMVGTSDGINILGLLIFSAAFGLVLSSMESKGKPLRDFFTCLNEAIMQLVNIVIWYSPVGFLFLLAGQIVKMADTTNVAHAVTMYTVTVITGLIIHSFITLPLIYFIVTQKNPLRFFAGILQALTTAFGTSSSSATLPVTLHCMEQNHNMDKIVTRFMLPMGATVNMDGSSLYEAVAALFIAQIHDIPFNFGQMIVLSLIVTAASSGSAGIPQAGMVTMVIVLSSAGLPTENIPLLLMVDWILDRLRTATNVLGDCVGVGVVQHLSKHELQGSSSARNNLEGKEMCSL